MNAVYILLLHYASATAPATMVYDSAALIGPVSAAQCQQAVGQQTNETNIVCVTSDKAAEAIEAYGCKVHESRVLPNLVDTNYICKE